MIEYYVNPKKKGRERERERERKKLTNVHDKYNKKIITKER